MAAFISGPYVYAKRINGINAVVICNGYSEGLRTRLLTSDDQEFRFLFVDSSLIESDITKGALGDFLTDKLLYPYSPIFNDDYVQMLGQKVRTRIVEEEVRELVIDYGEMCRGLVAKPEFFALSRMRKRARIFVPSMSDYIKFLDPAVKDQNIAQLRADFKKTIFTLRDDLVGIEDDNVTILDAAVDEWLGDRSSRQVVNILEQGRKAFYSYVARGRSMFLNLDLLAREIYDPFSLGLRYETLGLPPEDPKNYLYLRTATGLTRINAKASIQEVISTIRPGRPITISPLAGVLNEVFLVTSGSDRFVAKRFTDWYGFKWFTLNLVSFGSKTFSVSGRARMSNEYGVNRYLAKKRLNVPDIVHEQGRVFAGHVTGFFDPVKPRFYQDFPQGFEVIAILVRLEQVGRLGARSGIRKKILQASGVFRPPRPGFPAARKETAIGSAVSLDTLFHVGNDDAYHTARRQHSTQFS